MIKRQEISFSTPFNCPYCRQSLKVTSFYFRRFLLASYLLAALVSYGLGARGYAFVFAFAVATFLILFILIHLGRFFDPPKLQLSDDYSLNLSSRGGRGK